MDILFYEYPLELKKLRPNTAVKERKLLKEKKHSLFLGEIVISFLRALKKKKKKEAHIHFFAKLQIKVAVTAYR